MTPAIVFFMLLFGFGCAIIGAGVIAMMFEDEAEPLVDRK